MIEVRGLTKRYRDRTVLDDLTFAIEPGAVTGFLGPNGSGKTTTARILLGLARPDAGEATINGRRYRELRHPVREIGALVDPAAVDPNRTAAQHLQWLVAANRLPRQRADEVLALVGLETAADRKVGGFSLGMRQRLGIATALIGDPPVLMLDEPTNGLDPEGIHWLRNLMQELAAEGKTVFISSHLMTEMALTATELVVIAQGRLMAAESMATFTERADSTVWVRSPQLDKLGLALTRAGAKWRRSEDALEVAGVGIERVGAIASRARVLLHELSPRRASLEEAFMRLTANVCDYVPSGAA